MEQSFGERLAEIRKKANMTQEEVGNKLNLSAQAVSKWENDSTLPDVLTIKKLADLYGVSLDEIYGTERETKVNLAKKKNPEEMLLRVIVDSSGGDKVRVNLPLELIRLMVDSGMNMPEFSGNGKDFMKNIDFKQVLSLVDRGLLGDILDVTTADGDTVHIVVE